MRCLLDMDNVIVDFVTGSLRAHGVNRSIDDIWSGNLGEWNYHTHPQMLGMTAEAFYRPMDEEFWAGLDWMPDGERILEMVERRFGRERVVLATTPSSNRGCHAGKIRWMERHLPRHYAGSHGHVFSGMKWLMASPNHVLIDDSDANVEEFERCGGLAILVPRHWNRLHANRGRALEHIAERIKL